MPAPKYVNELLTEALDRLREGDHPRRADSVNAAINNHDLRIYLDSWVLPAIEDARSILSGAESVSDVKFRRFDR